MDHPLIAIAIIVFTLVVAFAPALIFTARDRMARRRADRLQSCNDAVLAGVERARRQHGAVIEIPPWLMRRGRVAFILDARTADADAWYDGEMALLRLLYDAAREVTSEAAVIRMPDRMREKTLADVIKNQQGSAA